jgi:GMP synthase PP-ATPase subunit
LGRNVGQEEAMSEQRDRVQGESGLEVAVLAGGCFWGVEEILRDVPGVVSVTYNIAPKPPSTIEAV